VCLILLLPLSALVMQLSQMSWAQYWEVITNPQVVAAYKVTLLSAAAASVFNGVFGLLMAWILTRYRFPGRTILDALMDLPFALPTAVAGLTLASLFSVNGFYGEWLAMLGIKVTYTWLAGTLSGADGRGGVVVYPQSRRIRRGDFYRRQHSLENRSDFTDDFCAFAGV